VWERRRVRALAPYLLLALLAPAATQADVSVVTPTGGLRVESSGSAPGRAIVEHFADDSRNGVRIRQTAFGDPPISSTTCEENVFANDVVCGFVPGFASITGGGLADVYEVGGSNQGCAATSAIPFTVRLGAGDDVLRFRSACVGVTTGVNRLQPAFDAEGEGGSDTLEGGRVADVLQGGDGRDDLVGNAGNDQLFGNKGVDDVRGSTGNDLLWLDDFDSADVLDGGSDVDSVRVNVFSHPALAISLDGVANDGGPGEGDNVVRVENVEAGGLGDRIVGSADANRLDGRSGDDEIVGGEGADSLIGGDGNDLIEARDSSTRDTVACGSGADTVIADLADVVPMRLVLADDTKCERIERFPADDGPPGVVASRVVRIRAGGAVRLRIACPRKARVHCAGTVRLAPVPRRTLARSRYRVAVGRRGTLELDLSAGEVRKARRAGSLLAITRERGDSDRGPRSFTGTLRVR
jgi:Ca2+-binding RTX toxin-like protein